MLFAQIQGSARIRLEDGTILRVNYDSHNGWPYTPVGRVLIERNIIPKDEMSMQRIREWMEANPDDAKDCGGRTNRMSSSASPLSPAKTKPVGGAGRAAGARPLDRDRSCAARLRHAVLHRAPICRSPTKKRRRNFAGSIFAQDTGSAIVGPARADIYFGAGAEAARMAGRIRNPGSFVMLLPRELDPASTAAINRCRRSVLRTFAQLDFGAMADPTVDEVPPPQPKPAAAWGRSRSRKRGACHEPAPPIERGRARAVDRLCAVDQAAPRAAGARRTAGPATTKLRTPRTMQLRRPIRPRAGARPDRRRKKLPRHSFRSAGDCGSVWPAAASRSMRGSICMA